MTQKLTAREIFEQAIEIQVPDERLRYVQSACEDDQELLAGVQSLLRANQNVGGMFDTQDFTQDSPNSEAKPNDYQLKSTRDSMKDYNQSEIIGPYKLLQGIGSGGMGQVWMAEQQKPVRRRVALKLIKAGMDTKLVIARFEAERQALALMDHPHIAKVFDAGTTSDGRPFFVMEYVRGKPITKFADDNHLTIPERLELFEQVCTAVQHAHHKGIIHRDLKPTNVLVSAPDGKPVSKVIDFGIAKATSQQLTDLTLYTLHDQFIGTPQYMSPGQAAGSVDIDTRTDVYSLGVILFELLTGTTPFPREELQAVGLDAMKQIIIEKEPPKPSTRISLSEQTLDTLAASRKVEPKRLGLLVRGELDWIVMKALDKERNRRYETPNSFSEDILAYLKGEPIDAAPPSKLYRMQKLIRKNRGFVAASSLVVVSLLVGIVGTSWGMIVARKASKETENALAKVTDERNKKIAALDSEKRMRDLAENRLYQSILAPIGFNKGTVDPAEAKSYQTWSELEEPSQKLEVLKIALSTPEYADQLAQEPERVVQAIVGIDSRLRNKVTKIVTETQQNVESSPQAVRAACLLGIHLELDELPALNEYLASKLPSLEDESLNFFCDTLKKNSNQRFQKLKIQLVEFCLKEIESAVIGEDAESDQLASNVRLLKQFFETFTEKQRSELVRRMVDLLDHRTTIGTETEIATLVAANVDEFSSAELVSIWKRAFVSVFDLSQKINSDVIDANSKLIFQLLRKGDFTEQIDHNSIFSSIIEVVENDRASEIQIQIAYRLLAEFESKVSLEQASKILETIAGLKHHSYRDVGLATFLDVFDRLSQKVHSSHNADRYLDILIRVADSCLYSSTREEIEILLRELKETISKFAPEEFCQTLLSKHPLVEGNAVSLGTLAAMSQFSLLAPEHLPADFQDQVISEILIAGTWDDDYEYLLPWLTTIAKAQPVHWSRKMLDKLEVLAKATHWTSDKPIDEYQAGFYMRLVLKLNQVCEDKRFPFEVLFEQDGLFGMLPNNSELKESDWWSRLEHNELKRALTNLCTGPLSKSLRLAQLDYSIAEARNDSSEAEFNGKISEILGEFEPGEIEIAFDELFSMISAKDLEAVAFSEVELLNHLAPVLNADRKNALFVFATSVLTCNELWDYEHGPAAEIVMKYANDVFPKSLVASNTEIRKCFASSGTRDYQGFLLVQCLVKFGDGAIKPNDYANWKMLIEQYRIAKDPRRRAWIIAAIGIIGFNSSSVNQEKETWHLVSDLDFDELSTQAREAIGKGLSFIPRERLNQLVKTTDFNSKHSLARLICSSCSEKVSESNAKHLVNVVNMDINSWNNGDNGLGLLPPNYPDSIPQNERRRLSFSHFERLLDEDIYLYSWDGDTHGVYPEIVARASRNLNEPSDIVKLLGNPHCIGHFRRSLLLRLNELQFHGGKPIYLGDVGKNASEDERDFKLFGRSPDLEILSIFELPTDLVQIDSRESGSENE